MEHEICRRTSKSGGGWCKVAIIVSLIYAVCAIIINLIIGISFGDILLGRCEKCDDATFDRIVYAHYDYGHRDDADVFVSEIASSYFGGDKTKAMYFIEDVVTGRDAKTLAKIVDDYTARDSSYKTKCYQHGESSGSPYFEGLYWIGHGNTLLGIFCAIVFAILMLLLSKTYTLVLTNKRICLTVERKALFSKKIAMTESYQLDKLIGHVLLEIKKKKYTISQLSFKTAIGQRSIYIDAEFYTQFVEAVNNSI